MNNKKFITLLSVIFVSAVLAGFIGNAWDWKTYFYLKTAPSMKKVIPEEVNIKTIVIKKSDDQKKAGTIHSRVFYNHFTMEGRASGSSPDIVRLVFEKKAEIAGILVSVDHSGTMTLVEFMARINAEGSGYGTGQSNALIHTSYAANLANGTNGKTDEHVWFGKNSGIEVNANDWITFGAWLGNAGKHKATVSPEFIVWYRWLE